MTRPGTLVHSCVVTCPSVLALACVGEGRRRRCRRFDGPGRRSGRLRPGVEERSAGPPSAGRRTAPGAAWSSLEGLVASGPPAEGASTPPPRPPHPPACLPGRAWPAGLDTSSPDWLGRAAELLQRCRPRPVAGSRGVAFSCPSAARLAFLLVLASARSFNVG